jgi:pyrroloquinoline quinone biosynthesis protein B
MSKIPHPFTTETTTLFENETVLTKQKIHFIHFNHTNPAIRDAHALKDSLQNLGFNFAKQGARYELYKMSYKVGDKYYFSSMVVNSLR